MSARSNKTGRIIVCFGLAVGAVVLAAGSVVERVKRVTVIVKLRKPLPVPKVGKR